MTDINPSSFVQQTPGPTSCWRAIVLFGRNVATYKFALAEALLSSSRGTSDLVSLEALALPFAKAVCRHLSAAPIQGTSQSSRFLEQCRRHNNGDIDENELRGHTVKLGFVNVVDAFHVVNGADVPHRFFIDERQGAGGLRLTEGLRSIVQSEHQASLPLEVEARWRLVETAWALGMSHRLVDVTGEQPNPELVAMMNGRRVSVTSARSALNGYQKGLCFYCFRTIHIGGGAGAPADVDHVIPHALGNRGLRVHLDGVWNLVLACQACNRGVDGKGARVPTARFMERLLRRNEYYVSSHHPLRETIIKQTGDTVSARRAFLRDVYREASSIAIHEWEPKPCGDGAL